jgi:hypothetical protein
MFVVVAIGARIEQGSPYSYFKMLPPPHHPEGDTEKTKTSGTLLPVRGWDPPHLQGLENH